MEDEDPLSAFAIMIGAADLTVRRAGSAAVLTIARSRLDDDERPQDRLREIILAEFPAHA